LPWPPLLARFVAQYPEIVLEVSADPALTDIVAARYDAGISRAPRSCRAQRGDRDDGGRARRVTLS
jgi:DNA-binding transcriptional LysR family regulator